MASSSYLVSVCSRKQVAQVRGKPIFVITGVALIPLSSQAEARKAIDQTNESLKKGQNSSGDRSAESDTSEDEDDHEDKAQVEHEDPTAPPTPDKTGTTAGARPEAGQRSSSIAEDVIGKKGQYGRFAERWFSKKGWSVDKKRMQGMSADEVEKNEAKGSTAPPSSTSGEKAGVQSMLDVESKQPERQKASVNDSKKEQSESSNVTDTLLPKLLRTTKMLLCSNSFYFSYDYDISRRWGSQDSRSQDLPLHKSFDSLVR